MGLQMLLMHVACLALPVITRAETNNAISNMADPYDVQKVDIIKKIYGGKVIEPPPNTLTVTEEIWMDVNINNYFGKGKHFQGRVTIACFGKLMPETCKNFISLANGFRERNLYFSYKGTKVQKIMRDYMIQLGDIRSRFGTDENISMRRFAHENSLLSHSSAGWVGLVLSSPSNNRSQFYITLRATRWLDGRHTLFGKVIHGMDIVQTIGQDETVDGDKPLRKISIEDSGVVGIKAPYELTNDQLNTNVDVDTSRG